MGNLLGSEWDFCVKKKNFKNQKTFLRHTVWEYWTFKFTCTHGTQHCQPQLVDKHILYWYYDLSKAAPPLPVCSNKLWGTIVFDLRFKQCHHLAHWLQLEAVTCVETMKWTRHSPSRGWQGLTSDSHRVSPKPRSLFLATGCLLIKVLFQREEWCCLSSLQVWQNIQ